ncbi:MAG: hypothetical protein II265_04180 [Clostridia bacterium]|nr:hypothetical protein [Clostridia bacterium]
MPKFSSFNAFGSESIETNQSHIPVWLGFPGAIPVGGTLDKAYAKPGFLLGAGAPVNIADKIITPFVAWEVVSMTTVSTDDVIVIKPAEFGGAELIPAVGDFIQKVGATFAATGKAAAVTAVTALTGDDAGKYQVKVLHSATVDSLSEGDYIAISAAAAAGSGKSLKNQPNGYLYNDIYFGNLGGSANDYTLAATGAVIMYHHDGLLVELTPSAPFKDAMKAAVPGVLQVLV